MKITASFTAISLIALASCTTGQDFDSQPYDVEFQLSRNYQAVYAGIYGAMRACYAGATIIIQTARVEGQLYPDLGYGEVYHGTAAVIPQHHYSARIEKFGAGSLIRIKLPKSTKPKLINHFEQWTRYWSSGQRGCPKIGAMKPPA